jgi:uncharacterized protein YuzE
MGSLQLRAEVSVDDRTGGLVAVYLRVRQGKVARTEEVEDGVINADFGEAGELLGVEVLSPCDPLVLESLADEEHDEPGIVRRFLLSATPRGMIAKPETRLTDAGL